MIRNSVVQMETIQNAIISFLMYSVVIWPLSLEGFLVHCMKTNQNANHLSLCNFIMIFFYISKLTLYRHSDLSHLVPALCFSSPILCHFSFLLKKKNLILSHQNLLLVLMRWREKWFWCFYNQQFSHPLRRIEQECWLLLNNQLQRHINIKAKSEVLMASVCTCL